MEKIEVRFFFILGALALSLKADSPATRAARI